LIYVSKDQLKQVEYLINQSIQGNHIVFDLEEVRKVFDASKARRAAGISEEQAYAVEHHIEKLMLQPSLAEKKAYLEHLDNDTFSQVVKTYFCIVENNIYEQLEVHH
jgi:hypothetical protein